MIWEMAGCKNIRGSQTIKIPVVKLQKYKSPKTNV
jgi:hypothetical protein